MKMAKASEKDMEAALLLQGILNDIDDGNFPRGINGEFNESDPDVFDPDDELHLLALYDRIKYCLDTAPGGVMRVTWGFHTLMHNDIVDPNDRCLALNPRLGACKDACDGISDDVLKNWMNPPEGSKGAPHGTWAEQLAEAGRQQVEMQKQINRLLAIVKVFRSHLGGALWTLADDDRELAVSVDSAIAEAEGVR